MALAPVLRQGPEERYLTRSLIEAAPEADRRDGVAAVGREEDPGAALLPGDDVLVRELRPIHTLDRDGLQRPKVGVGRVQQLDQGLAACRLVLDEGVICPLGRPIAHSVGDCRCGIAHFVVRCAVSRAKRPFTIPRAATCRSGC